ncbi:MAG TPA: ABC transporter substrate-binding protein [Gaiellaceae bacterium]
MQSLFAARRRPLHAGLLRRLSLLALPLALVLPFVLSACGEKPEPTGASVRLYPLSVRDADGHLVTLKAKPKSIAVAGTAPIALASTLRLSATRVGTGSGALDLGLIRQLKPQLVLAGSGITKIAIAQARALGFAVYVMPDQTLDGIEQALSDASLLAGVPLRGRTERARIADGREFVRTALAAAEPVRVFIDLGHFATASDSSFVGNMISEAGGVDVAGPDVQEGSFPLKRLRRLKPEVLVIGTDSRLTLAKLRRNPATRWLPAVHDGRVVRIDLQLLEPGPAAVDGLRELAGALHPDAFS